MTFVLVFAVAGMALGWGPLRRVIPSESLAAFGVTLMALIAMLGFGVLE